VNESDDYDDFISCPFCGAKLDRNGGAENSWTSLWDDDNNWWYNCMVLSVYWQVWMEGWPWNILIE
jgi:hypothetical protein